MHPSPLYSLWLPLAGLAAFIYLMVRLLARGGRGGHGSDGSGSGDGCMTDDGGCGGGDGGGD